MSMQMFDPTSPPETRTVALAPRPAALDGLKIGLVENTKFNSDTLLRKLGERLERRYGMKVVTMSRKRSPSHEVDDRAIADLKARVDVAISGVGD